MTLKAIMTLLTDPRNRVALGALSASLAFLALASGANAMVDLGATLHDAFCTRH